MTVLILRCKNYCLNECYSQRMYRYTNVNEKRTNILRLNSFQKYLKFCCEMLEFTIVHDSRTGITNKEKKISPTFVDFMIMIVLDI